MWKKNFLGKEYVLWEQWLSKVKAGIRSGKRGKYSAIWGMQFCEVMEIPLLEANSVQAQCLRALLGNYEFFPAFGGH